MQLLPAEFEHKAALLGHNLLALQQGEMIISQLRFHNILQGRDLLSVATDAQRTKRQASFFNPPVAARSRLGQGLHDRGEAILFANGQMHDTDHTGVGNHMPARLKAISILEKTVAAGQTWNVSTRGADWGIDDLEELYVTVNIGTLILEPGATMVVQGNVFSLLCQHLVCKELATEDGYHIGILPTPFSVDFKNGPLCGNDGQDGISGEPGSHGTTPQVGSSIIGYVLPKPVLPGSMCGKDGTDALNAVNGTDGRNGGMCKIAEITVRKLTGRCTVFARAGAGGHGGHGGHGKNGGDGGHGADGFRLINGILAPGTGGNGGNGSHGGYGGHGGHGGLASNIYINVPPNAASMVECRMAPSLGGRAGNGGHAGKQGIGGKGGIVKYGSGSAQAGSDGTPGIAGRHGRDGRSRPGPWMFVNEEVWSEVQANLSQEPHTIAC